MMWTIDLVSHLDGKDFDYLFGYYLGWISENLLLFSTVKGILCILYPLRIEGKALQSGPGWGLALILLSNKSATSANVENFILFSYLTSKKSFEV